MALNSLVGHLYPLAHWCPSESPALGLGPHLAEGKRKVQAFLFGQMGVYGNELLIGDDVVVEGAKGVKYGWVSLIHQVLAAMLELEFEGAVGWQVEVDETSLARSTSPRSPSEG